MRVLVILLILLPSVVACGPKRLTREESQARRAAAEAPAALVLPGPAKTAIRSFKVRAWVDLGYRRRDGWQDQLEANFARVNDFMGPAFGARLEVDIRPWELAGAHENLEDPLAELIAHDDGAGVDWVIGFVGASPHDLDMHEQLGIAMHPGRHLVVRDMNDAAERKAIDERFGQLPANRRHHLYVQHKRHKETAVLLHELAHSLGALHEDGHAWLMSPYHNFSAARFSPENAGIIALGLELRAASPEARPALVTRLREHVAGARGDLDDDERLGFLAHLEVQGLDSIDPVRAWEILARETAAAPDDFELQLRACGLTEVGLSAALVACQRAEKARPADARPLLIEARVAHRSGAFEDSFDTLEAARKRVQQAGDEGLWLELARGYLAIEALSRAEEAAGKAGARGAPLLATARLKRRWLGLPPDTRAPGPLDEWAYARHMRAIDRAVDADNYIDAAELVDGALGVYGEVPGLLAAACSVIVYAGDGRRGRQYCSDALAKWDETLLAHAVLGFSLRDDESVATHLARAIELDPSFRAAYIRLATAYEDLGRSAERARLSEVYAKRFGRPIPARPE